MLTNARIVLAAALLAACHRDVAPPAPHAAHHDGGRPPCHCSHDASMAPAAPLPDTSVFLLDSPWTDQNSHSFRFDSLRGSPTVLLMFYGTCQSVCPILISDVLRIESALNPAARAHTRFVLVTFDPAVDTAERLHALAEERHLDASRWTLLRGSDLDTRGLATVLGVQFSRVNPTTITHSNTITLLDPQGVVSHQLEGLRQPVEDFARRVEALVPSHAP